MCGSAANRTFGQTFDAPFVNERLGEQAAEPRRSLSKAAISMPRSPSCACAGAPLHTLSYRDIRRDDGRTRRLPRTRARSCAGFSIMRRSSRSAGITSHARSAAGGACLFRKASRLEDGCRALRADRPRASAGGVRDDITLYLASLGRGGGTTNASSPSSQSLRSAAARSISSCSRSRVRSKRRSSSRSLLYSCATAGWVLARRFRRRWRSATDAYRIAYAQGQFVEQTAE
jgi:hypothetical protein